MRKRITACLYILCLLLTGCGKSPAPSFENSAPMPGFDAQNKYLLTQVANVQETDNFFFGSGLLTKYLHYYDRASGISGILCWDPACGHEPHECRGYIGMGGSSASWYDGAIYWVAQSGDATDKDYYLWRDDLSGAGREKVKRISYGDVIMEYQPQWYTIHRGKLYFLGRANAVTETGTGHRTTLLSTPLDDFEEFTVLYDYTFGGGTEATVRFVGNSVYLAMSSWQWDENDVLDQTVTITKIDCTTGESEVIYEETGITRGIGEMWVTEQREIYMSQWGSGYGGSVWKFEDGMRTEIITWEGDDSYVKLMDGIAANFTSENLENGDRIRYVDIKTYAGETLYSGELFPDGVPGISTVPGNCSFSVVGGDREKIIVQLGDNDMGTKYVVLVDLSTMGATILWSE